MLAKQYRLPAHVKLVHPTISTSPLFVVKISKNTLALSRFGFIVTKKTEKRAVVRNRIKRVFRSCIEELQERIVGGYDMLFFVKGGVLEKKRESVYNELERILVQQNLL